MATPLPDWKELTYEQIDRYFGESVYRQVSVLVGGRVSPEALDLFVRNVVTMATTLETVRARVAAEPDPV